MTKKILIFCLLLVANWNVLASGGLGGGGGSFGNSAPAPRPTDPIYEAGKSLANGRNSAYRGVKVCIKNAQSGEVTKLKRKHLSPFKGSTAAVLAEELYSCKEPQQKLLDVMQVKDINVVLYYLNKRYKLKLG